MAILLALFAGMTMREQRRHLMAAVSLSAGRASDIIRRATRASMLRNQRTELHEIIQNVGDQPGIDLVRIYNKQGRIMFSTQGEEVGKKVDLQAEACYRCHAQAEPRRSLEGGEPARIFEDHDHRVLGWISAIPNESDCSTAPCHAHPPDQTVLGVLDVWMSLDRVDAQLGESRRNLQAMAGVVVLVVALSFGLLILRLVQHPVERLMTGTREVTKGNLDYEIPIHSDDDLGMLAESFNGMTRELRKAHEENESWAETLEEKVAEKTRELRRAHAHLVQMDRMASLGKLSATVAHEINNPLSGILTYARLVERELDDGELDRSSVESMRRSMQMISSETRRCGEIAQNLLVFARSAALRTESVHLRELVNRSLGLVRHHLELRNIDVEQHVNGEDDMVLCSSGEIQQAILGLMVNAVEAMPNGGTLSVAVQLEPEVVSVAIGDTGVGIPPEILPRIFEPFFTTKSETKGVGLGLAVVYGIMQRHGGKVDVESQVDVGSTFTLVWPRHVRQSAEKAAGDGESASEAIPWTPGEKQT
jgi:two-component system NtrC family sensor kinase